VVQPFGRVAITPLPPPPFPRVQGGLSAGIALLCSAAEAPYIKRVRQKTPFCVVFSQPTVIALNIAEDCSSLEQCREQDLFCL
jgi:hypothetical protein